MKKQLNSLFVFLVFLFYLVPILGRWARRLSVCILTFLFAIGRFSVRVSHHIPRIIKFPVILLARFLDGLQYRSPQHQVVVRGAAEKPTTLYGLGYLTLQELYLRKGAAITSSEILDIYDASYFKKIIPTEDDLLLCKNKSKIFVNRAAPGSIGQVVAMSTFRLNHAFVNHA